MTDGVRMNDTAKVTAFAAMFNAFAPRALMADLTAEVGAVTVAGQAFPYTVSGGMTDTNCYLCSPTAAYLDYAIAETRLLDLPKWVSTFTVAAIRAAKPLMRAAGLDRQVQINNWLVSTNPVPDIDTKLAEAIIAHCIGAYPDRAIVIRSLNDRHDAGSLTALKQAGFRLLAARQVWVMPDQSSRTPRDVARDAKLLRDTALCRIDGADFTTSDFARCAQLYAMLYLDKYTALNPHYTARYFEQMLAHGLARFTGLRDADGTLVAFTGQFESIGTLTQPFLGYDTTRPASEGLYRMLMQLGVEAARKHGVTYNLSAGAAAFKRNRGARPAIEYTAVYVVHRPAWRRCAVAGVEVITRVIGIPMVRRFDT